MDLRSKLSVSSSWGESSSLQHVLYITSSSGIILDQPLHERESVSVTLSQPTSGEANSLPCLLHIRQLTALRGYSMTGVEFQSGSRTVEVYEGEDYISTCKGSLMGQSNQESKTFKWHLNLASEDHSYDCLTLKLLSLQGKPTVDVSRLTILLKEDHGGKEASFSMEISGAGPLRELLHSFPTSAATNTPPFLSSLISSLQFYQASKEPMAALPTSRSQLPPEIAHMVSAFQEMRPTVAEMPSPANEGYSESHGKPPEKGTEEEMVGSESFQDSLTATLTLARVEHLIDDKMRELETRLKGYVDAKFNEMMNCIKRESKLEDLRENNTTANREETCPSEHNNGLNCRNEQ